MNTKEKLNKRRDELFKGQGMEDDIWWQKEGFNTLSPTWLQMYEALKRFCIATPTEKCLCSLCNILAEADKFLEIDSPAK